MDNIKNETLKYQSVINQMTLEEKASLMSGENFWNTKAIKRLDIPSIMLTDGPHGLRKQGGKADHLGLNKSLPATCFPTASTLANSWDTYLVESVGKCLGDEAVSENVSVLLGPGLNIKRNPLCGRNFEYFSEDPYLTGKMSASAVRGIQSKGVSACPKHFAVNSQEKNRMSVDEIVDKRALHEMYLEGFRYAVVEGRAKSIMTSYNKVNGVYANENNYLLTEVLQNQWGFDGLVVTDWGGNNDRVKGLIAGNGLEMPTTNGVTDLDIVNAVRNNELSESILDKRVDTLLTLIYDTQKAFDTPENFTHEDNHKVAIDAACQSIVMLKNDNVLPLKDKTEKLCVIGDFAKNPRYQGAGSSLINPTCVDDFLDAFSNEGFNIVGYEQGFKRLGGKSDKLKFKAVELAKCSDRVILYLGLDEGSEAEGVDREHMRLNDNQLELLDEIYKVNKNIVLILAGGSPIEMPFINKVSAILHGYLVGQGGGQAISKVLTGEVNPSGKLAETYPVVYSDVSSSNYYPGQETTSEHRESIFFGYRYFDTINKQVLFPFGFGMSYTTFEYSNLKVDNNNVTFTIKNTGDVAGREVAQVYVKAKNSEVFRASKELKGFTKVLLNKGEEKEVTITLDEHAFSYYNVNENRWVVENCEYEILVGASSSDIRLSSPVEVVGEEVKSPYDKEKFKRYYDCDTNNITKDEFERIIKRRVPNDKWDKNRPLGRNDIIAQAKNAGFFGRAIYQFISFAKKFLRKIGRPITSNNVMFILELPFRSISRMSAGKVSDAMVDGILMMVNGQFFKGFVHYINSYFKQRKYQRSIKGGI